MSRILLALHRFVVEEDGFIGLFWECVAVLTLVGLMASPWILRFIYL